MRFSASERAQNVASLAGEPFDVVVVGGGITGAGVALDAATRGLRTALVERGDFAAGTSSRSSKLVHGGLRYLNQREFRLVYEALAERQRLLRLAPHLVRPLPFLIPVFGPGPRARAYARAVGAALWVYDATGGARIGKLHRRLSKAEALGHMPDLDPSRLAGGFLYYDARVDDARLTLTVARTAATHGAVVANYVEATGLHLTDGRITGAALRDRVTGDSFDVTARVVVNAAGVWADQVRAMDSASPDSGSIRPAKGVHITLPAGLVRADVAAVLAVPGDRRSVFVVPWEDRVYVGTTDTAYDGELAEPACTDVDVDYLVGALNANLTVTVSPGDVIGRWAGLRPLLATPPGTKRRLPERTADLSRRHATSVSPSGLVSIVGGKLTTYRRMAADAVDAATRSAGLPCGRSRTAGVRLAGADGYDDLVGNVAAASTRLGVDAAVVTHLAGRHGGQARTVAALATEHPDLAAPLVAGLPYLRAEAVYAARYEMAMTLDDVLSRRTRALLLDEAATLSAAPATAGLLAVELGWDARESGRQVEAFRARVAETRGRDDAEAAVEAHMLTDAT